MKKEKLTKELAQKLMKIKGEARGVHFICDAQYVLRKKGKEGLKMVEKELERLGYPFKYKEVSNMDFYPVGLRALSLLAAKKVLNLEDEEIREVCAFQPTTPLVVKLYMKYFFSVPKIMKKAQDMWRVYWTVGKMNFVEYNKKKKYAVIRIEGLSLHPIWCRCMEGYFRSISKLVLGKTNIVCREVKCLSEGDDFHEYLIGWE